MPAFLLPRTPKATGIFSLSPSDLNHLRKSLRIKEGEVFKILLPDGRHGLAQLIRKAGKLQGKIEKLLGSIAPQGLPLWIGIGMVRWSRLEWFVEKATELGVARISPLLLARSRFSTHHSNFFSKIKRLNKIAKETLKQCERPAAPRIDPPQNLDGWLASARDQKPLHCQRLLFNEKISSPQLETTFLKRKRQYLFLIGPEGGFTLEEIQNAEAEGFVSVSLGGPRLRTETAALYGICALDLFLGSKG